MTKHQDHTQDNETVFERHFCEQLNLDNRYRLKKDAEITIDKDVCIYFDDLEEFLLNTQGEKLNQYQSQFGMDWKKFFKERFHQALADHALFELLQNGITLADGFHFDLLYFKPNRDSNKDQEALYKKNRFTAIRQWYFGSKGEAQNKSIDIVLCLNGFAIVTIELKNQGTSGTYEDAIKQYLKRDLSLPLFKQPFVHIVADNFKAMMATGFGDPPSEKDFRHFNKDIENLPTKEKEFAVHYLYHDILLPDRLLEFIESYLYPGKGKSWIFPRYHQQRATSRVVEDIKARFKESHQLDLRYLIQHSTGSGKSNTIVWMVQNLRNAFVGNEKIFDSIVVLTDRVNLDDQISKDFQRIV